MSNPAISLRARHEEVRSSAEAALPPPSNAADESTVRLLGRVLARAIEELTARPTPPLPPPGATGTDAGDAVPGDSRAADRVRLFGTVLAALVAVDPEHVTPGVAGLGSTIVGRDEASRRTLAFEIVPLELVDGSAARVTLASRIGQKLLGARPGDRIDLSAPTLPRFVRVEQVHTIWDAAAEWLGAEAGLPAPPAA